MGLALTEGHTRKSNTQILDPGSSVRHLFCAITKRYTEALRNEASQNERDLFVYVDLLRNA